MTLPETEPAPGERFGTVRRMITIVVAVGLALSAAACSSSKPAKPPSNSSTVASATSSSPAASGGSAADITAITNAYVTFFDDKTPLDQSEAVLQDGVAFKDTLVAQGQSQFAAQASATVSKVVVTSPSKASVTFTILLSGSPVLKDQQGYAVREGGVWKVAGVTFCGLLQVEGNPPPACKTAAATSLPG
jgi:hypothetical protein